MEYVNNCLQFVPITLIVYDWALMLGEEVDLIWKRQMKMNLLIYVAVRYFPFAVVILRFWVFVPFPIHCFPEHDQPIDGQAARSVRILSLVDIAAMVAIIAFVQVLLQGRIYAMYNRSRAILWTNAGLFVVEYAITIFLVFHLSSSLTPLCYESYLAFLAIRKSWTNRKSSRHLGKKSILDVLARGSAQYFILVASGMAMSMILFLAAPSFVRWLDLLTDATSSIGGARLILSVRKALLEERERSQGETTEGVGTSAFAVPSGSEDPNLP
ncbi:hypothetical protein AURDEDRAFT_164140 [Auricularia subglabra TFB-10046 SS5]|nr:hypothetical protein AURDEDRAFT_164140 [Auricularia subglabra TFB-10046 SS5]